MRSQSSWAIGYDLKRSYQRNYLIGSASVYIPLLITILVNLLFLPDDRRTAFKTAVAVSESTDVSEKDGTAGGPGRKSRGRSEFSLSYLLPSDFPRGYIGKYVLIREMSKPEVAKFSPEAQVRGPDIFQDGNSQELHGLGDGAGNVYGYGDDGFGLPSMKPYLPPLRTDWNLPSYYDSIRFSKKAVVRLGEPGWPGDARYYDTGRVVIVFTIYKDGSITHWDDIEVLSESPRGLGFGNSVRNAICFRGKFRPAMINGENVDTRIRLEVTMCEGCEFSVVSKLNTTVASRLLR